MGTSVHQIVTWLSLEILIAQLPSFSLEKHYSDNCGVRISMLSLVRTVTANVEFKVKLCNEIVYYVFSVEGFSRKYAHAHS